MPQPTNILVVNPNSSYAMTQGMENAIKDLSLPDIKSENHITYHISSQKPHFTYTTVHGLKSVKVYTYTAPPDSPPSIDNDDHIRTSTAIVLRDLATTAELEKYHGVLVACYSVHTLVDALARQYHDRLAVTGIFEASVMASMSLMPHTSGGPGTGFNSGSAAPAPAPPSLPPPSSTGPPPPQWGIVTTGKFWETHLTAGVKNFLGENPDAPLHNRKFRGVISTGLTAGDFHHVSPGEVKARLESATSTLLGDGGVDVVAMGCGGMAGLEEIIRSTAVKQYGDERGRKIYVVDGVKAGVLQLEQMIRSRRVFREDAAA